MVSIATNSERTENQIEIPENTVLFLVGAGGSVEAGVPMASQMVADIENLILTNDDWRPFCKLYYYLKSSILFADGIFGRFPTGINVEKLLVAIKELSDKEKNGLYPFVGAWNNLLLNLAGDEFKILKDFGRKISQQLFQWINIPSYANADYYKGFSNFKKEIGYPIRIFSFNYDLCIEQAIEDVEIELGFDPQNSVWRYTNFESNENKDVGIYLYKLHGSIDWVREQTKGNILIKAASPQTEAELIFGTNAKLTSTDPYLFYVFEFRKLSLADECKLIVVIGYSFEDEYMNKLIAQSLASSSDRKLLIVDLDPEPLKTKFAEANDVSSEQIEVAPMKASEFLLSNLKKDIIYQRLPEQKDSVFS